jgi:carboxymethylenebutenolidase
MIRTETVDAKRVRGYISHAENPIGGVLVLPTITAVDGPTRARADLLAAAGFTSLVWNPYPETEPPNGFPEAQARAAKLSDALLDDMHDCVAHLRGPLGLPKVAVMGFCLGGRYAVLLAAQDKQIAACVPYYPSIRVPMKPNETLDAIALASEIACPVHLVHGTGDEVFTNRVFDMLRPVLEKRAAATVVEVHPGAVHSFMRPDLQDNPANAAATRLSWPQAVGFLHAAVG